MVELDTDILFTMLYGLVALFNATVFGNAAEVCDLPLVKCGSRPKAIIAFAVFTFILSSIMLAAMVLRLSLPDIVHLLVAVLLFALNTVVAAVAISPRTGTVAASYITWWSETICFVLIFIALSNFSKPAPPKPGLETSFMPEPVPSHNSSTAPPAPVQYQPPAPAPATAPDV